MGRRWSWSWLRVATMAEGMPPERRWASAAGSPYRFFSTGRLERRLGDSISLEELVDDVGERFEEYVVFRCVGWAGVLVVPRSKIQCGIKAPSIDII